MRNKKRIESKYESLKVIMCCILLGVITIVIGILLGEISIVVK